ncbi:MAG: (5-formylfuran-3-yl)methyl phosphate synthase, partial [Gemmataceae bacterium]
AAVALAAGADLIDVKEPNKGSLGPAEAEIVAAVLETVGGKVPVSAALGEWTPNALVEAHWHLELPLPFIKWGLAGYAHTPGWGEDLLDTRRQVPARTEVVLVSYVDHKKAKTVAPAEVVKFAKRYRYKAVLFDTYLKDAKTLLNHTDVAELAEWIEPLKSAGILVALGGSLKFEQIKSLRPLAPDYFAVRGAVCLGGAREADLDPNRIKKWKDALAK